MSSARLEIRVQPKSSRTDVVVEDDGRIRVYVTAAPEGGKANDAAVSLLAKRIGVAKSQIRIGRGLRSRNKDVIVGGVDIEQVHARLAATALSATRAKR